MGYQPYNRRTALYDLNAEEIELEFRAKPSKIKLYWKNPLFVLRFMACLVLLCICGVDFWTNYISGKPIPSDTINNDTNDSNNNSSDYYNHTC